MTSSTYVPIRHGIWYTMVTFSLKPVVFCNVHANIWYKLE